LQQQLRAVAAGLPPTLGGARRQPLEVGRATRGVQPAQRAALAVRDGGCVFPGCDRPLAWCDAHHLWHWLDGGPTDLANLALLCRAHHRAVHEGGGALTRAPAGRCTPPVPPASTSQRRLTPAGARVPGYRRRPDELCACTGTVVGRGQAHGREACIGLGDGSHGTPLATCPVIEPVLEPAQAVVCWRTLAATRGGA